jgi:chromosome segregation ATPase
MNSPFDRIRKELSERLAVLECQARGRSAVPLEDWLAHQKAYLEEIRQLKGTLQAYQDEKENLASALAAQCRRTALLDDELRAHQLQAGDREKEFRQQQRNIAWLTQKWAERFDGLESELLREKQAQEKKQEEINFLRAELSSRQSSVDELTAQVNGCKDTERRQEEEITNLFKEITVLRGNNEQLARKATLAEIRERVRHSAVGMRRAKRRSAGAKLLRWLSEPLIAPAADRDTCREM